MPKRVLEDPEHKESPLKKSELHPTKNFQQYPLDVKFLNYKDRKRILITGGAGWFTQLRQLVVYNINSAVCLQH